MIQDNCKMVKRFWIIPMKPKNIKFPHIGRVIIDDDVEQPLVALLIEAL